MASSRQNPSVYDYSDYRKFLTDCVAHRKQHVPPSSLRSLASQAGIDEGNLSRVLSGKRPLTVAAATKLCPALKLRKRECDFFQLMVRYNEAGNHDAKKACFEEMLSFKESRARVLDPDQYEFYDKWYYTAVREALSFFPYNGSNARELGRLIVPSVSSREVRGAIALLERLGLVEKGDDGVYRRTSAVISSGRGMKSVALNNYIINTMELAKNAIGSMPGQINLSSLALTIAESDFAEIQEELRDCRARILEIARKSSNPDRVYTLNMHLFPLTRRREGQ